MTFCQSRAAILADIENELEQVVQDERLPGLSVGIVVDQEVVPQNKTQIIIQNKHHHTFSFNCFAYNEKFINEIKNIVVSIFNNFIFILLL